MANRLTVLIPAFNEESSLKEFLPKLVEHCREKGYSIIAVNDGSTDKTGEIIESFAKEGRITALHHKVNRGYGGAIKSGIEAAKTEFIITMDADGQHRLDDVDTLFETIVNQDADMVVGSRRGKNTPGLYRSFGKLIIRTFAKVLMHVPIYDINSGMKVFRSDIAKKNLHLCPDSMPFSDVFTLLFVEQRHLVLEIPIKIGERQAGKSTVNTKTAFETALEILNILVLFNPMRIFIPISFISILGGILWGLPIIISGRGVSVGAMLAVTSGLIFFFFGLIAEQLSMIRKSGPDSQRRKQ